MAEGQVTYEIRADDTKVSKDIDKAEKKMESELSSGSKKAGEAIEKNLGSATANVEKKSSKMSTTIKDSLEGIASDISTTVVNSTGQLGTAVSGMTSTISSAGLTGAAAFAGIGTAAVAVGGMAINVAADLDSAMAQFAASTGKSGEALGDYEETLKEIYAGGYGESFTDISDAMATVTQQMGDLDQASLQNVTESAFLLRDTFGYDINESVRAASTMMTQFGIDGDTAMALIAKGAQNGLDYSGELLDSISEYSVQFAKVGLDADDMFKIMQKGAETGAFNLDKVGDAIKEMSIRVVDGSNTTKQGFELIGLNADEMSAKFAAGGESAKEAFGQTVDALAAMEDPLEQNIAGVDLFGTMWEDLGPEVVTQLADIEDGAYATTESLEEMKDQKMDGLNATLDQLKRSLDLLIEPLGNMLIPLLTQLTDLILPLLTTVLEPIMTLLTNILSLALQPIMDLLNIVLPMLTQLLESILAPLQDILSTILQPLLDLINMAIQPIIDLLQGVLMPIIDKLMPIIKKLADMFSATLGNAIKGVKDLLDPLIGAFRGVLDFITGVFTGNWERAWNGIVTLFKNALNILPASFEWIVNAIVDIINGITGGISSAWTWAGLPSIPKIPHARIPRFKAGIDFVPNDFFPAFLDAGERVLTREENAKFNAMGGLTGLEQSMTRNLAYNVGVNQAPITIVVESPVSLDGKTISRNSTKHQYINTAVKRYK